jgi:signal transduction histidine kinase/PAS domain-containing protein
MPRADSIDELQNRLAVQSRVADVLAAATSLRDATLRLLEIVCTGLGWDWGALWEVDRSADALRCVEVWHRSGVDTAQFEATTRQLVLSRGQGLTGQVWTTGKPEWMVNCTGGPPYPRTRAAIRAGFHAGVAFPIRLGTDILGVMEFLTRERRLRDEETLRFLGILGSQIGQFIARQRAEEQLRRSEQSLAEAQRVAQLGSWDWRPQTGELTWSDEVYRIFGYEPGAFPPSYERFLSLLYQPDRERVDQAVVDAIRGAGPYRVDHRICRPSAELRVAHSEGSVTFDASGRAVRMLGTIQDITERTRIEQEREQHLAREQALARISQALVQDLTLARVVGAVVEQASTVLFADVIGVWLADSEKRELRLQAFHGRSPETASLLRHLSYDSPSVTARAAATGELQLRQKPQVESSDLPITQLTTREEGIQTILAMPLHSRGVLVGVVSIAWREPRPIAPDELEFDATVASLCAVAISNAALYDQVRETLRLREEFMAGVAHALRTPVTVIKGSSQFAMKVDAREQMAHQTLEQVVRQSDQISAIIDDLLAVMRLRQGDLALRRQCLDLTALARDVVEQFNRASEANRVELTATDPFEVDADPGLVERILVRVIENALLYSPEGSSVDVRARREGTEGVISVTNQGPSIPPERQRHVFEPFYESVPPGSPGYVGIVSLGLYLSKQLLAALGGRIWLTSFPGEGTTLSFGLPLAGSEGIQKNRRRSRANSRF